MLQKLREISPRQLKDLHPRDYFCNTVDGASAGFFIHRETDGERNFFGTFG
jgi:hypothetical protein